MQAGAEVMDPTGRQHDQSREAALALGAASGRREDFAELVRRYERPLFGFLLARCGSREEAEELCQESLLRAWTRIDRYHPRWRFSTWLFTLARRLAISRRRSAAPPAQGGVELLGVHAGPSRQAVRNERRDEVWALAERVLSADQRTALWLRYAEGLSAGEIGRVLGRRAAAVRALLHRARATLAEHLDPELCEEPRADEDEIPFLPALRADQALEGGR